MNKTVLVRVTNIGAPPPVPGAPVTRLNETDRIMVNCAGDVMLQIPVEYAETLYGAIAAGDILEVDIRKIPELGRRIGEAALTPG